MVSLHYFMAYGLLNKIISTAKEVATFICFDLNYSNSNYLENVSTFCTAQLQWSVKYTRHMCFKMFNCSIYKKKRRKKL